MAEMVHSVAREKGLLLDFKCKSFATASQRVRGSYGAENIKTMQEAAVKYDPEGVFQKLQYGGFLLRNNVQILLPLPMSEGLCSPSPEDSWIELSALFDFLYRQGNRIRKRTIQVWTDIYEKQVKPQEIC